MKKFISFSGGVESRAMALLYGNKADAIFADTHFEFDELYEGIEKVEKTVREYWNNDFKIIKVSAGSLVDYINESKFYPSFRSRFCTRIFKIEPIDNYLKQFNEAELMIGLNAGEEHLRTGNHGLLNHVKYTYPLIKNGITRQMCIRLLDAMDLNPNFPPYMKRGGCIGCYYKGKSEMLAMYHLNKKAYNFVKELEEQIQDERGKKYYVINNIHMSLKKFGELIEKSKEIFKPEEIYPVINDSTNCGVFCNR